MLEKQRMRWTPWWRSHVKRKSLSENQISTQMGRGKSTGLHHEFWSIKVQSDETLVWVWLLNLHSSIILDYTSESLLLCNDRAPKFSNVWSGNFKIDPRLYKATPVCQYYYLFLQRVVLNYYNIDQGTHSCCFNVRDTSS